MKRGNLKTALVILVVGIMILGCTKKNTSVPSAKLTANQQDNRLLGTWKVDSVQNYNPNQFYSGNVYDTLFISTASYNFKVGNISGNCPNWNTQGDSLFQCGIKYQYSITGNVLMLYQKSSRYWFHKL